MSRLLDASKSFRKKEGRHQLRTENVAYCAFSVPNFEVPRSVAQRDAASRLSKFGLNRGALQGRSVLDLGSNAGAMLLQASNFGIRRGVGIEFDQDKVDLSNEIAAIAGLEMLEFKQGDVDKLDAAELGRFDVVMALAIEAHVLEPDHLFRLLADVTAERLVFEGNGGCDIQGAGNQFSDLGFASIEYLGFCDDDVRPANNKRPLLVAIK
ncbi:class I SAM-dependent methyltransferase [Luteimonas sp. R10]|uniref:class I SAM-dependent methyltransferase n=1 Tax=Luteimonas sp. R10 TaxID=3108176 RepID=UPI00309382A9|nr:class I SAM-dependent methyltransferase [Luteimonas sp. R10]